MPLYVYMLIPPSDSPATSWEAEQFTHRIIRDDNC